MVEWMYASLSEGLADNGFAERRELHPVLFYRCKIRPVQGDVRLAFGRVAKAFGRAEEAVRECRNRNI